MRNSEPLIDTDREISLLIRAKFPVISIVTYEERRVLTQLEAIRDDIIAWRRELLTRQLAYPNSNKRDLDEQLSRLDKAHQILLWTCTNGLRHWSNYTEKKGDQNEHKEKVHSPRKLNLSIKDDSNPVEVMLYLRNHPKEIIGEVDLATALFVFSDLHHWLDREDRQGRFNHMLIRIMRDMVSQLKFSTTPHSIILISPRAVIPSELSKDIQVIDYPLPTVEQLEQRFISLKPDIERRYGDDSIFLTDETRRHLMQALSGLTYDEAENVLAKSLANNGRLEEKDIENALSEKRQIIRKDGLLEYFDNEKGLKEVGGLELLLEWLGQRRKAFAGEIITTIEGTEIKLPIPKGILLVGVPGGGKSLVAKAIAKAWSLPLLRLDIGRIFGGIIGQSEENMRRAIGVAESVAPAVVWLDEIEKAFPKVSGQSDSGVSLRVMNTFLSWMQEKKKPVFVVATGNDISQLPPELTRKGRFDEIFYVGLPDLKARQKIFEIHSNTRGLPLSTDNHNFLASKTRWYTGAEIEQVINNSLFLLPAFRNPDAAATSGDEPANPTVQAILAAMTNFVPLAERKGKDGRGLLTETLEKARTMATPASNSFETLPGEKEPQAEMTDDEGLTRSRF